MLSRIIWFTVGLTLIMAALLGNAGAVIASMIDPADMLLGSRELAGIMQQQPGTGQPTVNCDALCGNIPDLTIRETCFAACLSAEKLAGQ
jgi:hypothetical protein